MNGIGAQEICVTTAMGVCDFISAMDTARMPEWNCWYHIMNCGFPLKVQRRDRLPVHHRQPRRPGPRLRAARQGRHDRLTPPGATGIAKGRSYVSDGYAHALEFSVNGTAAGPAT